MDAGGDQDLPGVAIDRARNAQVFGDGFAQRTVTGARAVGQHLRLRAAPVLVLQATPDLAGKLRHIRDAGHESAPLLVADAGLAREHGAARRQFGFAGRIGERHGAPDGFGDLVGRGIGDEGAGAGTAFEIAFGQQLFVGVGNRVARHAKLAGKIARRRQLQTGRQSLGEDGFADQLINLTIDRGARAPRDASTFLACRSAIDAEQQIIGQGGDAQSGSIKYSGLALYYRSIADLVLLQPRFFQSGYRSKQ